MKKPSDRTPDGSNPNARRDYEPDHDLLLEAAHAEQTGDHATAASKLRAHLAVQPGDDKSRLKLGRLLLGLSEATSARQVLGPLDAAADSALAAEANRLLAALDENEGALTSAQIRWERVLADDIDDVEARGHLKALRPREESERGPSDLSLGTLVSPEGVHLSRFTLIRELGRGATAAVYLVRDERLGLALALKVLHPQLAAATRADARDRFFAEARLAARLRHPNVVAIYGVDEDARCLAMEFVSGGTIRDRLRAATTTRLQPAEVLLTARSLLAALDHVHAAGIVHGDLKPGNILLRHPGEIVLADFGVAEFAATALLLEDRAAGTPLYLAPEQFQGARPSTGTDLFAAGAILWEMVNGRPARRQADLMSGYPPAPAPIPLDALASLGADARRLSMLVAGLTSTEPSHRPVSAAAARALVD